MEDSGARVAKLRGSRFECEEIADDEPPRLVGGFAPYSQRLPMPLRTRSSDGCKEMPLLMWKATVIAGLYLGRDIDDAPVSTFTVVLRR
jgi:hypothetical protein